MAGNLEQRVIRHGAQRVQGDAGVDMGEAQTVDGLGKAQDHVRRAGETALVGPEAAAVEAGAHVERGQQRQPDAGRLGRPHQRQRQGERLGIGAAVLGIVQILKLADLGIAARLQLPIEPGGDDLEIIRRDPQRHTVHAIAP